MLRQTLQQKLLQKLSPQQIQLMKLLQVPTADLEQRIKEELESNPALEEGKEDIEEILAQHSGTEKEKENDKTDDIDLSDYLNSDDEPYYKSYSNNYSADTEDKQIPITTGQTFQEYLQSQLGMRSLKEKNYILASQIIGNINEDGYLMRDIDAMVDDIAFNLNVEVTEKELKDVLTVVQNFEPAGVGARNLQECLLIQLKRKQKTPAMQLAITVISKYFEEFTRRHYDKILKKIDANFEDLKQAIDQITILNPKPGSSFVQSSRSPEVIIPDFILKNSEEGQKLYLNSRNAPELKVSHTYSEMFEDYSKNKKGADKKQKEAVFFIKQKLDAAKWFIDAIKQRQNTLLAVMQAILEFQKDYFADGDETKLKPMILKDIADKIDLDISTVSRVANSKYLESPYGTFLLKSFFSESLSTKTGETVSTREVKKILSDCISNEDSKKPLTDEKLTDILKDKGYNIARRTVAKYREQLEIPVARLRKSL